MCSQLTLSVKFPLKGRIPGWDSQPRWPGTSASEKSLRLSLSPLLIMPAVIVRSHEYAGGVAAAERAIPNVALATPPSRTCALSSACEKLKVATAGCWLLGVRGSTSQPSSAASS
jgi:hypothetical protein